MSDVLFCQGCGRPLTPGEALAVHPTDGSVEVACCRPSLVSTCLARVAPTIYDARIATYDQAEADRWDALAGGSAPDRGDLDGMAATARRVNDLAAAKYVRDDGRADG